MSRTLTDGLLKLDQIYKMGFPLELAKKALIKTKNQSTDAALELLLAMDPIAMQVEEESLLGVVAHGGLDLYIMHVPPVFSKLKFTLWDVPPQP